MSEMNPAPESRILSPAFTADPLFSQKYALWWDEVSRQAAEPPSGDAVIQAIWKATPYVVERSPDLEGVMTHWLARQNIKLDESDQRGKSISQVAGEFRSRIVFDRMLRARRLQGWEDPAVVERGMLAMARDPARLALFQVMLGYPQNTTHRFRYGVPEVVRQLMADGREPVDMADGGSSIMIGVNQIAQKEHYPFRRPRLLRHVGVNDGGKPLWTPEDPVLERAYGDLLTAPPVSGRFTSIDLFHPRDPNIVRLSHASLRPVSEIRNRRFMYYFHALAGQRLSSDVANFTIGDITNVEDMRRVKQENPDRKYRVVFLGTVMSELGEENIPSTLGAVMELLDDRYEDAVALMLDFVHPDPDDPYAIRLHPRWSDGTYTLLAIYKHGPKRGQPQELFRFVNSRATEVIVGPGEIMVNGAFMGVREALLRRGASRPVRNRLAA